MGHLGIMGGETAAGPMAWRNRLSDNMYTVYSNLLQTEKVVVSLDRYGVMRPTQGISFSNPEEKGEEPIIQDRPNWRTKENW